MWVRIICRLVYKYIYSILVYYSYKVDLTLLMYLKVFLIICFNSFGLFEVFSLVLFCLFYQLEKPNIYNCVHY